MLFTIYLPRLAGPCQRWLAGGGRAAAEPPCLGHSHGDMDGDRTPRADRAVGTETGGRELAQQPRLRAPQASPKGKALLLRLPRCRRLLLCSLPRASPVGTNQPFYATSRRSIPAPAPERVPRTRHPGAGPDLRLCFLPRAASCRGPITPCRSLTPSGFSPAPHGAALAYPHTVFLRRLPPCTVFLPPPRCPCCRCRGLRVRRLPGMSLSRASLQRHGGHAPAPHTGEEHRPGHAGTPPASTQQFRLSLRCRRLSAAALRPSARQAWSTAPLPLSIL